MAGRAHTHTTPPVVHSLGGLTGRGRGGLRGLHAQLPSLLLLLLTPSSRSHSAANWRELSSRRLIWCQRAGRLGGLSCSSPWHDRSPTDPHISSTLSAACASIFVFPLVIRATRCKEAERNQVWWTYSVTICDPQLLCFSVKLTNVLALSLLFSEWAVPFEKSCSEFYKSNRGE